MSTALIGYLGYETIEQFEKIPERKLNDLKLPDGFFIRPTVMAIFDNLKNQLTITSPSWYEKNLNLKKEYSNKVNLINKIRESLQENLKKLN